MTSDRPRQYNSTLRFPAKGLTRTPFPRLPGQPFTSLEKRTGLRSVPAKPRASAQQRWSQRVTRSTIPPDVLALVDARDGHFCVRCGRWQEVIEHHHRRIKGSGGDTRPHTECPCCIVSLCPWWSDSACHTWAHANRLEAEAAGLIVPRSAASPFLYSVLVQSEFGSGARVWPTCTGIWTADEPDGAVA